MVYDINEIQIGRRLAKKLVYYNNIASATDLHIAEDSSRNFVEKRRKENTG